MQVKKFEAPTLQEALETVKRELGPEAIILQTRKNKGGFGLMSKGSVEVTAAVSERALAKRAVTERKVPQEFADRLRKAPASRQADFIEKAATPQSASKKLTATRYADIADEESAPTRSSTVPRATPSGYVGGAGGTYTSRIAHAQLGRAPNVESVSTPEPAPVTATQATATQATDALLSEIERLEKMIRELRDHSRETRSNPNLPQGIEEAMDVLMLAGVDRRQTYAIMKQVSFELGETIDPTRDQALDEAARLLLEQIEVMDALDGVPTQGTRAADATAVMMALVGTSGCGKTATAAKLAGLAQARNGLRVGLIHFDMLENKLAHDPLEAFARIMKLPYRYVVGRQELAIAAQEMASLDLVMIDTVAVSQRDDVALQALAESLRQFPSVRIELILQAGTRDQELNDIVHRFHSALRPEGLIFTKLDEAIAYGPIYNVSQRYKLPLVCFTTGQKVPEDIEPATKERLVALLLDLV